MGSVFKTIDIRLMHPEFRGHFPALRDKSYFNYGGQGTLSQLALDAIVQAYEQIQQMGPFSLAANHWVMEQADLTRQALAVELGVDGRSLSLTEDVTVGCNIFLWGLPWQTGDHLLISDAEHPGVVAAVQELMRRHQVEVSVFSTGADVLARIERQLQPNTRLVVMSHILWNTGQILPLAEINRLCHRQNTLVLVDAAQSVGQIPLALEEWDVDGYAFTGHKWLCGPEGLGGLYVNPRIREQVQPTFVGWRGIQPKLGRPWQPDGRRYEVATSAFPLMAGLRAALDLQRTWGDGRSRYQRILHLSQSLSDRLQKFSQIKLISNPQPATGLVCFQVDSAYSHAEIVQKLEEQRIFTRTLANPDCIRACLHYFSSESEIEQLVTALKVLIS